jgi:hypothetical protein
MSAKTQYIVGEPLTEIAAGDRPTSMLGAPIAYRRAKSMKLNTAYSALNRKTGKRESLRLSDADAADVLKNLKAMRENGIDIPVVADHSLKAGSARGWIVGADIDADKWLCPEMQLIGQDAIIEATRNRNSIGIQRDFVDGQGRKYPGASIEHIAITPVPVADSQGPLLAASRGEESQQDVLVFTLSAAEPQGDTPMKAEHKTQAIMQLSGSDEAATAGMADDEVMSRMLTHHVKLMSDRDAMLKDRDAVAKSHGDMKEMCLQMSMAADEANAERDAAKAEAASVLQMSREPSEAVGVLAERSLRIGDRIDLLVERIPEFTPGIAKKVKSILAGTSDQPAVLMLSRDEGAEDCPAGIVVALLQEVLSSMKTVPRTATTHLLSRENPAAADHHAATGKLTPERRAELLGSIGLEVPKP